MPRAACAFTLHKVRWLRHMCRSIAGCFFGCPLFAVGQGKEFVCKRNGEFVQLLCDETHKHCRGKCTLAYAVEFVQAAKGYYNGITTSVQSTITFIYPNFIFGITLFSESASPSPASVVTFVATSMLTSTATSTMPAMHTSQLSR